MATSCVPPRLLAAAHGVATATDLTSSRLRQELRGIKAPGGCDETGTSVDRAGRHPAGRDASGFGTDEDQAGGRRQVFPVLPAAHAHRAAWLLQGSGPRRRHFRFPGWREIP